MEKKMMANLPPNESHGMDAQHDAVCVCARTAERFTLLLSYETVDNAKVIFVSVGISASQKGFVIISVGIGVSKGLRVYELLSKIEATRKMRYQAFVFL